MAITNTAAPSSPYMTAFDERKFTFTSDKSAEPNFLMKCEVKDSAGTVVDTLYVDDDGSGNFIFDVAPSLQAQVSETILAPTVADLTTTNTGSYFQFKLTLTEIYDDSEGLPKAGDTLDVTQIGEVDMVAYNAVNRPGENFVTIPSGKTVNWLTDMPSGYIAALGQPMQLSLFTTEAAIYGKIQTVLKAGSGTSVKVPGSGTVSPVKQRCILPVPGEYFTNTVKQLIIGIYDGSDNLVSPELTINVGNVSAADGITLFFKNHKGGFDSYTFTDFDMVDSPRGVTYKAAGVKKTFHVEPETVYDLYGKFESNAVLSWLSELYNSKSVYMVSGTSLVQVNILSGSYDLGGWDLSRPRVRIEIQPLELN